MVDMNPGPDTLLVQEIAEPSLAFETIAESLDAIAEQSGDARYAASAAWLKDQGEPEIPNAGVELTDGFVTVALAIVDDGDDQHFMIHVTGTVPAEGGDV